MRRHKQLQFAILPFALVGLPLACGLGTLPDEDAGVLPSDDEDPASVSESFDCESAYGDACGADCSPVAPCAVGLHCVDTTCQAQCVLDEHCDPLFCRSDGSCGREGEIDIAKIEDIEVAETDPDPDTSTCIEGQIEFAPLIPQVWLLLDRSGSMSTSLSTTTRWEALGNVLLGDPLLADDVGVVGEFEDRVAFGATFYTTGSNANGCVLNLSSVALATDNYGNIRRRYNKLEPSGGTPTAESVAATVATARVTDLTGGPKILVLATDGAPANCASGAGVATTAVETEVSFAFTQGISTYAISITSEAGAAHMQRVANLGVGLPATTSTPAPYYTADTTESLREAFASILSEVPRSCIFELNGDVKREKADEGSVALAGTTLDYQDVDGWSLKAPNLVEILGSSCDLIRAGEEDVDIGFPCSAFTPVVVK